VQFYGRDSQFTHGLKYGPDDVSGMVFQWQNGKQVTVWPAKVADGKMKYPSFSRPTN
jgi:branched-chain amino acid transport system substrate-binding protein